jgi:hypothetical protein
MDDSQPSRIGKEPFSQPATARPGRRQARQRSAASALGPETFTPVDRLEAGIQLTERNLAEAYRRLLAAGVDRDQLDTGFAVLWGAIAEIKTPGDEHQRDLAPAYYGQDEARRHAPTLAQYSGKPGSVMPDMPGFNLCPDPGTVQTPAEFMDCLRRYRIWAGKISYREMERKCGRRFAASTICTALQGDELPSFDLVLAIVVACGGGEDHQLSFLSAWRSIQLEQDASQPSARPQRSRALRAVSRTA